MFCIYCGHEILDHHSYCTSCGKLRIDIALKKFEEPSKEVGYFVRAETVEEATMRGSKEGLLDEPAMLLKQGGCGDVAISYSESENALHLSGVSPFEVGFKIQFSYLPERQSAEDNFLRSPKFRTALSQFVKAFTTADWESVETGPGLRGARSLKEYAASVERISRERFNITISPKYSRDKYLAKVIFDKGPFLSYLNRANEEREREQAAREEAGRPRGSEPERNNFLRFLRKQDFRKGPILPLVRTRKRRRASSRRP